jgi:two-component system response regulator PilR (NtrC family)
MKPSILIVDDEKATREGLSRYLSHEYRTLKASNGKEAVELLRKNHSIDIVLSDIRMPQMDGMELLERIHEENPEIIVIFITAFYSIESAIKAIQKGAYNYLNKPIDLDKLDVIIKNAINNKKPC